MEMVISAFNVNLSAEEAIAPQSLLGWLMSKITRVSRELPGHIHAITKVEV